MKFLLFYVKFTVHAVKILRTVYVSEISVFNFEITYCVVETAFKGRLLLSVLMRIYKSEKVLTISGN